jgi:FixJ family two-component response regulator
MTYQVAFLDDEPTLREAAETLLPAAGISVRTFSSWKSFQKEQPECDCVVCDWHLLDKDPKKQLSSLPTSHVIVISGIPPQIEPLNYPFLKKPFRFKALIDTIRATSQS